MQGRRQHGMALVSVLLLLAAMLTMAVALQLLALLGALSTRNQIAYAAAEAEQHTRLTHSLLLLESQLDGPDELPVAPLMPAGTHYSRISNEHARLQLDSPEPPNLALEVIVELSGSTAQVIMRR